MWGRVKSIFQIEVDYLSNHQEGKMTILDLKVWDHEIDGLHRIVHKIYVKDVSSKAVMFAKSALSLKKTDSWFY